MLVVKQYANKSSLRREYTRHVHNFDTGSLALVSLQVLNSKHQNSDFAQ